MTLTSKTPTPSRQALPECVSEIQVHFSKPVDQPPSFTFTALGDELIVVTQAGEITVPHDRKVILTFGLTETSDASRLAGIQLGWSGPVLPDTAGGRYPLPELPKTMPTELPFQVDSLPSTQGQALVLTDWNDHACSVISYQIYVIDKGGNRVAHDPKIYNKGDGSGRKR